mmetsp:Transcript_18863/g.71386  ORF Transcript_18863/g.71386 Transcript_18863/m.71386 type:complete len:341 (-) Transcript_18863:199-1221(-)
MKFGAAPLLALLLLGDCGVIGSQLASRRRIFSGENLAINGLAPVRDSILGPKETFSDIKDEKVEAGVVRIFICRHGETEYNRLKLVQGRKIDAPLNADGINQAGRLGDALRGQNVQVIASSRLLRAKQTADILRKCQPSSPAVERRVLPMFDEVDFGSWEGRSGPVVGLGLGVVFTLWGSGTSWAAPPGGESLRVVLQRFTDGLHDIATLAQERATSIEEGQSVVIVAHSALIKAFLCSVGAEADAVEEPLPTADELVGAVSRARVVSAPSTLRRFKGLRQKNCCINVLDYTPSTGEIRIRVLNDTKHLSQLRRTLDAAPAPARSGAGILRLLGWRNGLR